MEDSRIGGILTSSVRYDADAFEASSYGVIIMDSASYDNDATSSLLAGFKVAATIMPLDYRYKVWILCNDCNDMTEVFFHIIGHKCGSCHSYNTRTVAPPPVPTR